MNNAQIGDKILSYDNQQSAEINTNKNKIETVEQGLTTTNQKLTKLDTKLSKDYIVDYGSNENGYYEKWASGKLFCMQSATLKYANANYLQYAWQYPSPPLADRLRVGTITGVAADITTRINNANTRGTFSANSATIRAFGSNFASNDTLVVNLTMMSFWK